MCVHKIVDKSINQERDIYIHIHTHRLKHVHAHVYASLCAYVYVYVYAYASVQDFLCMGGWPGKPIHGALSILGAVRPAKLLPWA